MIVCNSNKVVISSSKLSNRLTSSTMLCNNHPVEVLLTTNHQSSPSIINDVINNRIDNQLQLNTGNTSSLYYHNYFMPRLRHQVATTTIYIPTKVQRNIERYVPKQLLDKVHKDRLVAIELCLMYISLLTNGEVKSLKAEYLRDYLNYNNMTYKHIRNVLQYELKDGPIVYCDEVYIVGSKSFHHKLNNVYINRGIVKYELQTNTAKQLLLKDYNRKLSASNDNKLCRLLLKSYNSVQLPTVEYATNYLISLAKSGHITKKGKLLRMKRDRKLKSTQPVALVEENIDLYDRLTSNGVMYPLTSAEESGGRVYDSFNLMPSSIRNLIKINNEEVATLDYKCLHPNIAMMLYGGTQQCITHQKVADALNIDLLKVKEEHLAFFNKDEKGMKKSILWDYYNTTEPKLISLLLSQKKQEGHESTFSYMANVEVAIMTDVISILLEEYNVPTIYIFDAIMVPKSKTELALEIMNKVIESYNVYTTAAIG